MVTAVQRIRNEEESDLRIRESIKKANKPVNQATLGSPESVNNGDVYREIRRILTEASKELHKQSAAVQSEINSMLATDEIAVKCERYIKQFANSTEHIVRELARVAQTALDARVPLDLFQKRKALAAQIAALSVDLQTYRDLTPVQTPQMKFRELLKSCTDWDDLVRTAPDELVNAVRKSQPSSDDGLDTLFYQDYKSKFDGQLSPNYQETAERIYRAQIEHKQALLLELRAQ